MPAVEYISPLANYKPLAEAPAQSWREANERVGRIGGWRVYAREAARAEAPVTPAAAAPGGNAAASGRGAAITAPKGATAITAPKGAAAASSTSAEAQR